MPGPTVLIVEDEPTIADAVALRLRSEGYETHIVSSGAAALSAFEQAPTDLIVLDVMLPGLDGLEVCRRIRRTSAVPILMLTARDDETDVVVGLEVGADDYVTKPFSMRELVARVRALLRRGNTKSDDPMLTHGPIRFDPAARRVWSGDELVHLTTTEFDLAHWLLAHPNAVFSREQLLRTVWGYADGSGARTVDSHIQAVRRKLGYEFIRTVHGVGYALGDGLADALGLTAEDSLETPAHSAG